MTAQVHRLTPLVKVPAFLLRDRDRELSECYDEIERLHGENATLKSELAELRAKDWLARDSVAY